MFNELLAPAGNLEAVKTVIDHGADAVYCSGKRFGARSFITNLTDEEIIEASHYVHLYGKKIYITLNTLIFEDEISEAMEYVDFLYQYVDAIIVQDFGIIHYIRAKYPDFPVHVSTQTSIHNIDDVKFLKSLGISRVVLARELSLGEIKEINKLDIELEIFIHGALCFSFSGMCYLSYYRGGRSGNRGSCAQPCRETYELVEDDISIAKGPLLSMKDLNTISNIKDILDANITSLKIEGRAKSLEYQALVVSTYRKLIDQYNAHQKVEVDQTLLNELYATYSRERTKGYLFNDNNKNITTDKSVKHQGILIGKVINYYRNQVTIKLDKTLKILDGIRIIDKDKETGLTVTRIIENKQLVKQSNSTCIVDVKERINPGALVFLTQSIDAKEYVKKHVNPYKNNAKLNISIKNDEQVLEIFIDELSYQVIRNEHLEKAKTVKEEAVISQFSKTNKLPINYTFINYENNDNYYLPISLINEMRSSLLDKVKSLLENRLERHLNPYPFRIDDSLFVNDKLADEYVIDENRLINFAPLTKQEVAFHLAEISPKSVISPYFGVSNHLAVNFFRNITKGIIVCSFESTLENTISLSNYDLGLGYLVDFNEPLMVSKHCPVAKAHGYDKKGCQMCEKHTYQIKDNKYTYDLRFKNCFMYLYGKRIKRKGINEYYN